MSNEKVYSKILGELYYKQCSPTLHSWFGEIDGCEQVFTIMLDQPNLEKAEIEFIHNIVSNWRVYLEKALMFVLEQLKNQPEIFEVEKEKANCYLSKEDVPASLPQFCFYENCEWTLHFTESSFPIADPYGFGVNFDKEQPINIENFSDAELMEDFE